jgi:hypothetical protein
MNRNATCETVNQIPKHLFSGMKGIQGMIKPNRCCFAVSLSSPSSLFAFDAFDP